LLTQEGPRDRAVGIRSKEALVQTGGEGTKQFALTKWSTLTDHGGGHALNHRRVVQNILAGR